jgi:O-antigen/teichoic acid export membrane protein
LVWLAVALAVLSCMALRYSGIVLACTAIAGVGLVFSTVATTAVDLLQAMHRLPTVAIVTFAAGLTLTTCSVAGIWMGVGPVGLSAIYLVGPVACAASLLVLVHRQHFPVVLVWKVQRVWDWMVESRFFIAQNAIGTAGAFVGALLLPQLIGTTAFGFFTAGTLLTSRLQIVPDALCTAAYPMLARLNRCEPRRAMRWTMRYLGVVLLCCLPIAGVIAYWAGLIAGILFPTHAALCEHVIRITIWALPLGGLEYVMGCALNAAGREAALARADLSANLAYLAISVPLRVCFGLEGACGALVLRPIIGASFRVPLLLAYACGLPFETRLAPIIRAT